eukprot:TRINITY_DN3182_c0_g2_i1.p1 TRINITY_DN3182_c0_g2~~TRINITY_DN3182_c0_g2_i1.p1  ORF type:complete len:763 (+),score=162.81 TRINITY_DN3182_c0_g2_i1:69-2291(+)
MGCICSRGAVDEAALRRREMERTKYYAEMEKVNWTVKNKKAVVVSNVRDELKVVNNYKSLGRIAKGAFGTVYLAEDKCAFLGMEHLRYAIKVVSRKHKQVSREVKILCEVDHPNVVKMVEWIDDPAEPYVYLIFEAGLGGVLCECSEDGFLIGNKWTEEKAKKHFAQLADCLEYLHAMGIVHRDIKPENMVFTTKSHDRVQLIDFGESRMLKTCDDSSSRTVGTPLYHSPESTDGTGSLFSEKAKDVWALGATLYLVLMGTVPFGVGAKNTMLLWERISEDPLVFPKNCSVSDSVLQLLTRMLEKDPTLRATPAEIKDHLWITGCNIAPRITEAVTFVEDFTPQNTEHNSLHGSYSTSSATSPDGKITTGSMVSSSKSSILEMPGNDYEEVSAIAPVVIGERRTKSSPSSSLSMRLSLSERRTFNPPSLDSNPSSGTISLSGSSCNPSPVSSRYSTRNVSFNTNSPMPPSLPRTGSQMMEVGARRNERMASLKLPKTPKLTKASSIPALTLGTPDTCEDDRLPSPVSVDSCERTPMSQILNIVSQDSRAKVKILVVDPVYHNREILARMMQDMIRPQVGVSFDIDTAEDGDEAVRAVIEARDTPYAAILMEIHMSRVTGVSATTQIRICEQQEGRLEVPIFGMATDVTPSLEEVCRDAGMQCLFRKPISSSNLAEVFLWLNIICKKRLNEEAVFSPRHGWHESYKRNLEKKVDPPANISWWYTVDIDDSDVSLPEDHKYD